MAAAQSIHFDDGIGQIRIGRRTDLELSLPYSALSGVHARLVRPEKTAGDRRWMVEDLGSTNGTFLEGERLKPGVKHAVTVGTQIKLAEIQLIFEGEVQAVEATVLAVDPKVASPELKVPAAPARVPTPAPKAPAAPARVPTAELKVPTAETNVPPARARAPTAETSVPARERVPTAELKVPPARARVPTAETNAPPAEAKAPPGEPTQTFVRRKTSGVAVTGRPVTAAVPFLTAVSGLTEGATTFRLEQHDHVYMFGRTRRCEFRVQTAEVSREHATFTRRSDGIYVNDLGSVNGVLVNNTRVSDFRLYDGDLIQVGRVRLRLFDPTETGHRGTDSVSSTPSRLAPPDSEPRYEATAPPPERSATFGSELHPGRSELHPAIAGHLASEGIYEGGHRQRRPSVAVRFTESWETSSRFRYGFVIVVAALLAFAAVTVGFRLAS